MNAEQFCYWLQGRAEMQPNNPPSTEEWKIIAEHLQLVFRKETSARIPLPAYPTPEPSDLVKRAREIVRGERQGTWPRIDPHPHLDMLTTGHPSIDPVIVTC